MGHQLRPPAPPTLPPPPPVQALTLEVWVLGLLLIVGPPQLSPPPPTPVQALTWELWVLGHQLIMGPLAQPPSSRTGPDMGSVGPGAATYCSTPPPLPSPPIGDQEGVLQDDWL